MLLSSQISISNSPPDVVTVTFFSTKFNLLEATTLAQAPVPQA